MPTVKTAISVDKSLLARIDLITRSRRQTRSSFFAEAARDWLSAIEAAEVTKSWNAAYSDDPIDEDIEIRRFAEAHHWDNLKDEPW